MKCFQYAIVCLALGTEGTLAQEGVQQIATLFHGPLKEVSGITRSSHAGVFWVHNDSGNQARLFAITLDGKPVVPPSFRQRHANQEWPGVTVLNASNVDWEDITFANDRLYIAETGNNRNARRNLGVYEIPEPDPYAVDQVRALRFIPIRYPDQRAYPGEYWHFDCEALFVADGKLHFLTKHRKRGKIFGWEPGTKLYRLDSESTKHVNELTLVGRREDLTTVTAADMSPDGERLAVLTYMAVWIFERPVEKGNWLAGKASRLAFGRNPMGWNEAITWQDDDHLIIANEQRQMFKVDTSALFAVE